MKPASLTELKKEIAHLTEEELRPLVLSLAKFSKDNKELLHYLLFEADFESNYIEKVKAEIDLQFAALNRSYVHALKKGLQKILRELKKNIKYSGKKQTEAELLIHFCKKMMETRVKLTRYPVLFNMYNRQLINVEKALSKLDEDLQYDYKEDLELISSHTR